MTVLRQVITKDPPLSRYHDTVTGETWFDHGVFERALANERHGMTALLTAVQYGTVRPSDLFEDTETYLARYHADVLRALEAGEPWE